MKNVLFISYFFPPIRSVESLMAGNLAKYLPQNGFRVHVIHAKDPEGFAREERELPAGIETIAVKAPTGFFMRALYSLKLTTDPEVAWLPHAARAGRKLLKDRKFDLIFSRANPISSHLAALRLKKHSAVPWVAFYGDPGAQHPYISYRFPFLKKLHERLDARVLELADAVIVTTEETRVLFVDRYGHAEKIFVLPNTFDPEEFAAVPKEAAHEGFSLLYAGSFYNLRSPANFLEGLSLFLKSFPEARKGMSVTFLGSMGKFNGLPARFGCDDVARLVSESSHAEVIGKLHAADAFLLIDADLPRSPFLPSKVVEYLAMGKPILALTPHDGASAKAIEEAGSGTIVPPSDVQAIAKAIEHMWKAHAAGELRISAKAEAIEAYDARNVAKRFSDMVENLT